MTSIHKILVATIFLLVVTCASVLCFGNCQWSKYIYLFQVHVYPKHNELIPTPENYTGLWIDWHTSGGGWCESQFVDGMHHGSMANYFYSDTGHYKYNEEFFFGDVRNGTQTMWDEDGQMVIQNYWRDGEVIKQFVCPNISQYKFVQYVQQKDAPIVDRRILDSDYHAEAMTLYNEAERQRIKGEFGKADESYMSAIVIYEKKLGSQHALTKFALGNLASQESVFKKDLHKDIIEVYWEISKNNKETRVGDKDFSSPNELIAFLTKQPDARLIHGILLFDGDKRDRENSDIIDALVSFCEKKNIDLYSEIAMSMLVENPEVSQLVRRRSAK